MTRNNCTSFSLRNYHVYKSYQFANKTPGDNGGIGGEHRLRHNSHHPSKTTTGVTGGDFVCSSA